MQANRRKGLARNVVDTNVNDDGIRLDPRAFHELGLSNGGDDDISSLDLDFCVS
jgi:hypothetical protein